MQVKLYIYLNIYMQAESAGLAEAILFIRKRDKMINDDVIKLELLSGHFQFCHLWSHIFTFLNTCVSASSSNISSSSGISLTCSPVTLGHTIALK